MPTALITGLDHEGRGVARVEGKVVFIDGALPGETVEYKTLRARPGYDHAEVMRIVHASAQRERPSCRHFGVCGGCSMQHLGARAQAAVKQRVMEDAFAHLAKSKPEALYPVIMGMSWGYRHRARLGVRRVPSRGGVLIGFHEKRSSYIADLSDCPVLPAKLSALLPRLHTLIAGLSIVDRVPQIEAAVGEGGTALVFRHLLPLPDDDVAQLKAFAAHVGVDVWTQAGQPDSAQVLVGADSLFYTLPEFGLRLDFRPTDFIQVNAQTNRLLVRRALQLLDPRPGERVADLFCGLGNFTLPIASLGATAIGVEGNEALTLRAENNANINGLGARATFHTADLFETTADSLAAFGRLDKLLLDPPREGAIAVVKAISPRQSPPRIVYVSCNPATLARDAAVLVHEKGYTLRGAGIANLFPHTSHVESIALFER
ncbi:MAG: 23S rRNA (uracil(1939)-C(5))-methyltransferase RlmD [Azoarcus sp.]|jgi:23S rRNA (uracil1939-C5)-methyltransferase|nr:23S rRNA (uracil(1939)-C(5))-methyltransferase RlmD [Azoarcus sp.]